jgi:hypothetical protein
MTCGWISYQGGGARGGAVWVTPPRYERALGKVLAPLKSEAWQQWWRRSGQPPCRIWVWVGDSSTTTVTTVRRTKHHVTVRINRAILGEFDPQRPPELGETLAASDCREAILLLQARFGLPDPPALGSEYLDGDLSESDFWEFLDFFAGHVHKAIVPSLVGALAQESRNRIVGFDQFLSRVLDQLGSSMIAEALTIDDQTGDPTLTEEDRFLYARCEMVTRGPEYVHHIVNNRSYGENVTITPASKLLLTVGKRALDISDSPSRG